MKKQLITLLLILFVGIKITAQVGISATNTPPNPSAMLDVSSTNKGLLPPRMSTAQRNAIASPADGLLVFDNNTQSYWYRRISTWTELPQSTAAVNFWQQTGAGGNEIKNTNTGGFWSANPVPVTFQSTSVTNPPTAPVSGNGTRMMWIPSRAAFRAGSIYTFSGPPGDYWDAINIGICSFGTGYDVLSNGFGSFASGASSSASGFASTAMGFSTMATGQCSTAIGCDNIDNPQGLFMVGNGANFQSRFTSFIIRKDNNRVGIGVEDPIAKLHVIGGSGSPLQVNFGQYFTNTGGFNFYSGLPTAPLGTSIAAIYADGVIVSNNVIGSYATVISSDNRIKNIISLSNNTEDLERLKKIEITNYRMKDVATWGNQTFKKVIAQQVESVYPEVIKRQTSVIPDIYTLAESVVYDATDKKLSVSMSKDYGIKLGDKVELVHPEKGKIQAEVVEVSGKTFTVKDWQYPTDKIFVFGREVNDFRSVDYEALSMLGISAIQALAKENEEMKKGIIDLKKLKLRIEAIEATLNQSITTGK